VSSRSAVGTFEARRSTTVPFHPELIMNQRRGRGTFCGVSQDVEIAVIQLEFFDLALDIGGNS